MQKLYRNALVLAICWAAGGLVHFPAAAEGSAGIALSQALAAVSGERMLADVKTLSGPEFNGRRTGTDDDLSSARFVAHRMTTLGLLPIGQPDQPPLPGWAMTAPVRVTRIDGTPRLELSSGDHAIIAEHGADFLPILDSPPARVTAPLIFVGYGISDPARGYDDYAGMDVRDRVVLFLRGKPERYPVPVSHTEKERTAREKGAVAFITVTAPVRSAYEARRGANSRPAGSYGQAEGERPIPGCWMSTELADRVLAGMGRSLAQVQAELNGTGKPHAFLLHSAASLSWESADGTGLLVNIAGKIAGADPAAYEAVVVGAHRDHLGRQGSLVFSGADDNASGTAVMLEVARVLQSLSATPKRSLIFVSFSGEEQGLLGSRLYVSQPPAPLRQTAAMINIDHAGVGNGRLTVGVTGLPKEFAQQAGAQANLSDKVEVFGFFPGGDHVPFKEAGVPTITVVSSGPHPDFHQPTDTADKVQPAILEATVRYVLALVWKLAYE
jgi:hypothetical protein